MATQRPSSNVVTGLIKANITNRIAFNVATGIDSRVIIDQMGAEKLTGLGDMLFSKVDWGKPRRIQAVLSPMTRSTRSSSSLSRKASPTTTRRFCLPWRLLPCPWLVAALFARALPSRRMTTRLSGRPPILWWNRSWAHICLQRRLKVGYARAGRIMDMLEEKGVVGPPDGSKPREVLLDDEGLPRWSLSTPRWYVKIVSLEDSDGCTLW